MSLMRRREMMDNQEREENTIYIDSGFLDNSVHVYGTPRHNEQWPDSWATTYFPVSENDVVKCAGLSAHNTEIRIRQYRDDGSQSNNNSAGQNIAIDPGMAYARLMYLNHTIVPVPADLSVTHPNGAIDTYKIIDRR